MASFKHIVDKSLSSIKKYQMDIHRKIKKIEDTPSKQNEKYDNTLLFYNSLSLVMLSMLAGGLVGVVFILYFSFKNEDKPLLTYN